MRHAETVTFGGSGLDRAAELRGRDLSGQDRVAVVLWRGKVLISDAGLMRLPLGHPLLARAVRSPVLLGREAARLVLAVEIGWQPEEDLSSLGSFVDASEQVHPDCPEGRFAELRRIMTQLGARDAELAATAKAIHGWHATHGFCARCGAPSEVSQSGWQRNCTRCGAPHFPRTDPVVIMLITHGNRCLLGRSPGWPEGMYSCLAGFVEPGETIEAAVRREVLEESGIRVGRVRYLASQPWAFPSSLMFGCHGAAESDEIRIDPAELEDARWLTREEVADSAAGLRTDVLPARKGAIAHFLLNAWLTDRLA
ncbi:NAD(+) diphosphatase [Sagittula salina]|uniref:NAD(+) diphosphatase n=1 Tax=Sagittula salina TaxID=2820268 RepID=A0A940MT77_9RHOB|nr:NAD(+) diphosphatase [Sagittula salina]MBP0482534.1 NAD(+) diphosphatase [Sagittula salina]